MSNSQMTYNIRDGRLRGVKKSIYPNIKYINSDIADDVMLIHCCKHLSEALDSRLISAPGELSGSGDTRLSPVTVILT